MIIIQKGKVDVSVVIGAIVVFAIIGAAIFGIYYFVFLQPAREDLEDAKTSALNDLDTTLATVNTSQATSKTMIYRAQINEAGSESEVTSIVQDISATYELESKREDLLENAEDATHGSFYTLEDLYETLKSEINSKTTKSQLDGYDLSNKATSAWRELLTNIIENIGENKLVMRKRNTPTHYWRDNVQKSEALSIVQSNSWQTLHKMTFENSGSYAVPILDTYQRAPTVLPGSTVDIAAYDYSTENLSIMGANSTVLNVIYPKDVLGTISWTLTDGATSYSYSTDVWEAIKAAKAGDTEAADVAWKDYAKDLMESAQNAGIGDYDLQALYVVKVPSQGDAELLTQYEQYMTTAKDLILIAHTT